MIRCPNFRSDEVLTEFNGVLQRLGGVAMAGDDISPRQPYLAKLNETQTAAYHTAHYLWNAHKKTGDILDFLDALDAVNVALEAEPVAAPAKTPAQPTRGENETRRTPSVPVARDYAQDNTKLEQTGTPAASEAAPLSNLPSIDLARSLLERLRAGKPITTKILQEEAGLAYGGKLSEGRFDRKDMADALELAVNMHIAEDPALRIMGDDWQGPIAKLDALLSKLPTQRVRSEEQVSFQQFSTPPNYAAAAVYAANLGEGDVMIEPSAGTGSIVAAAMRPGVKIIANELSERRTALLRALIGSDGKVFRENAEQLNNTLLDAFTPFAGEHNLAAAATPELARPLVHIYTNEDWAGRRIHEDPVFQHHPNAYSARRGTGQGWSAIAKGVNTATGGSPGKSGALDLYPEDYREMIDQFAGTQIRLGQNVWDSAAAIAQGKWPDATKIPLERVIRGTDYDAADRARGYELRDKLKHPWKN